MMAVRFLHLASLGFWLGSTLFLFVFAPGVFAALPRQQAGDAMNAIFPRYDALCQVLAAMSLATLLVLPERTETRLVLLGVMLALLLVATQGVAPALATLRGQMASVHAAEAGGGALPAELAAVKARWGQLHGVSMALNLGVFLVGLALFWVSIAPLGPLGLPAPDVVPGPPR